MEERRYEDQAEEITTTGFQCKTCKRFWGIDKHMASWCCSTSQPCECGGRKEKHWIKCQSCRTKDEQEKKLNGRLLSGMENFLYV